MSEGSDGMVRKVFFTIIGFLVIGVLVFVGIQYGLHLNRTKDMKATSGEVALSRGELRDVVRSKHLNVYWVGPVEGNKYSIFVPKTGVAVVRYIPPGASVTDASPSFRLVATYVQKDAFATTQLAGAKEGNLGFINIDGNAVFYVKTRPTNVYVGIKGHDVQLEIFDPGQDQAVALALFRGQIQQIK